VHLDVHLTDSNVPLAGSGFDVAIRGQVQDLDDSSYKARKIGQLQLCIFAARTYVDARPRPTSIEDLSSWDWVRARPTPWARIAGPETSREPRIVMTTDNYTLARKFVEDGLGFMVEAYELVERDIRAGRLVQLLRTWSFPKSTSMRSIQPTAQRTAWRICSWTTFRPIAVFQGSGGTESSPRRPGAHLHEQCPVPQGNRTSLPKRTFLQ